jgi:hypothetical protein
VNGKGIEFSETFHKIEMRLRWNEYEKLAKWSDNVLGERFDGEPFDGAPLAEAKIETPDGALTGAAMGGDAATTGGAQNHASSSSFVPVNLLRKQRKYLIRQHKVSIKGKRQGKRYSIKDKRQ